MGYKGTEVIDTGATITMPVGDHIKGRLFNVVGEAIDGISKVDRGSNAYSIHQKPPAFENLSTETEILYTGIKVIDLVEPFIKKGKDWIIWRAGVGKTVLIQELIKQHCKRIYDGMSVFAGVGGKKRRKDLLEEMHRSLESLSTGEEFKHSNGRRWMGPSKWTKNYLKIVRRPLYSDR